MSIKDSNIGQREDIIKQEDVNQYQYVDDQKAGEFDDNNNNTLPLPSYNQNKGPLYEDDRPVYPSYNSYYYDKYSFNNEEEDHSQDFQYENEDYPVEDDGGFFNPHPYSSMHPPPPPPHPNFGPMPPHMSYHIRHHQGPPPPPQPWIMNDMAYDPPRSLHRRRSRSSKGRYNEEGNPENEEAMLHLMQKMTLDPLSLRPSMPTLSPQSQHPLNNSRRRKASFT